MKKNRELISVIVPIYNVEKYLSECIDTLIKQSFDNLEIILIDDGSTDNCPTICDEYQKKDKRIKVIHKKNGGLSDARNSGLKIAKGEYIIFVDSDDFVNINFVEVLYNLCVQNNSEMAICKFARVQEITDVDWEFLDNSYEKEIMTGKEFTISVYEGKSENLGFVAWNKIYKKELFEKNKIEYPVNRYYEDTFTTFKLLYYSKKVVVTDVPLYYYRSREGSIITSNITLKKLNDMLEADIYPVSYYDERKEVELFNLSANYCFRDIINTYNTYKNNGKEYSDYIIDFYIKNWKLYCNKMSIGFAKKVKYMFFYYKHKLKNKK